MCLILKTPPVSDTTAGKSCTMRWTTLKSESLCPGLAGGWCSFWCPRSFHAKVNSYSLSPSHILFHETLLLMPAVILWRLVVWAVFLAAFSHVYGWSLTLRCRLLAKTYFLILFDCAEMLLQRITALIPNKYYYSLIPPSFDEMLLLPHIRNWRPYNDYNDTTKRWRVMTSYYVENSGFSKDPTIGFWCNPGWPNRCDVSR